jgi:hypothetical protein
MRLIEGALQESYQPSTLRDLEKVLQWERGSARRILAGGDPVPLAGQGILPVVPRAARHLSLPPATPEMALAMTERLAEIEARVKAAQERHPGGQLTGAMIFMTTPRMPAAAYYWDWLAEDGQIRPEARPAAIAAVMTWDEEREKAGREGGSATGLLRTYSAGHGRSPPPRVTTRQRSARRPGNMLSRTR